MDYIFDIVLNLANSFGTFFQVIARVLLTDFTTIRNAYMNGLSYLITNIIPPYTNFLIDIPNIACDILSTFANGISVFTSFLLPADTLFLYHFILGGGLLAFLLGALRVAIGWISK